MNIVFLVSIAVEANPTYNGNNSTAQWGGKWALTVHRPDHDSKARQVHLRFEVTAGDDLKLLPYSGHLQAAAEITFDRAEDAALLDQAAAWNATGPLVGFIRSHLDAITAVGPYARMILGGITQSQLVVAGQLTDASGNLSPLYPQSSEASE
ncbi:MAG: hypothetical protein V4650_03900 [Pseudomonadota bacterium]